jgi:anti-sigma B factor antagonist/stage II sporulation protein AA (anti-sigma F factor antagonist)
MAMRQSVFGDTHEIFVNGRIDGAVANEMEEQVIKAEKEGAKVILVNLAEADFICSAGIRVILQHWRQLRTQGRRLQVTRPSQPVLQILEMTGFRHAIVETTDARA